MTQDNSTENDPNTELDNESSEETTTESNDIDTVTESETQDDNENKEKDVCTDLDNCQEVSFIK